MRARETRDLIRTRPVTGNAFDGSDRARISKRATGPEISRDPNARRSSRFALLQPDRVPPEFRRRGEKREGRERGKDVATSWDEIGPGGINLAPRAREGKGSRGK